MKKLLRNILSDQEFYLILAFNLALLVSYFFDKTTASSIVMLYFFQSVFIGIQYFIRMLFLGAADNQGKPITKKFGIAFFFLFHYGFFHVVYSIFLFAVLTDLPGTVDFGYLKWLLLVLLGNTIFSTISDVKRDLTTAKVPVMLMFQPYLRIVPMHLLIIFGFNADADTVSWAFMLFVVLKTIADLLMHVIVNGTFKSERPNVTGGWI